MNLNSRQKAGIGLIGSGLLTGILGGFILATTNTPAVLVDILKIVSMLSGALGIIINLPSDTNPK